MGDKRERKVRELNKFSNVWKMTEIEKSVEVIEKVKNGHRILAYHQMIVVQDRLYVIACRKRLFIQSV